MMKTGTNHLDYGNMAESAFKHSQYEIFVRHKRKASILFFPLQLPGQLVQVLPLENKLKHPEDMLGLTGVLTTGMSLVTIIYTYCGFFGYITYGENVQGSITLNLPDSGLNVAVKILLVLVVFFGNVLQMYVIIEMLWPPLRNKLELKKKSNTTILILEYLFRAGVVCFARKESHPGAGIIAPGSAGIAGRPGIPGIPPGGSTPNGVRHQTRVIGIPICAIGRWLVLQLPSALHVSAAVIPPSTAIRARNPGKGITDPAATACTKPALHIKQAEKKFPLMKYF
ncbi:hypothetical protein NECAME_02345 [Necator americanus]|uniref:Amino acid transporter transmembrane domain-containing protein n=1 Tax=Necator americanus TaxID=51031 RepID=W2TFH0_NECAM|nr:hypothetical protein NECAME_02345 [Necator americanus]ETN80598.1 hypothetical protein NECAME_02345 [Necator americanus]